MAGFSSLQKHSDYLVTIVRFVHNHRRKEWKSNVSIQDYPTDYDVEMECRNAIYSKIWTEETTVGISTIVFRPVGLR